MDATLLLLADSRLPAGAHVHSGGVEAAVGHGLFADPPSLEEFLRGRLRTVGLTSAGLAAAACAGWDVAELDREADARTPVPGSRTASRTQGRSLLRAAAAAWPSPTYAMLGERPHHAIALGVVVRVATGGPAEAALVAAYNAVTGPAAAAVRLLGLDPLAVNATLARLATHIEETAEQSVGAVSGGRLPRATSPMLDILAAGHHSAADRNEVTLFAS